ncbi:MAG: capsid protein [Oscillospiraceae bacterium]|nr:capsid protein [Oscillospiraceae bacterium]
MNFQGLILNTGLQLEVGLRFSLAQKIVDSEVLRRSDPYVPFLSGKLKESGTLGTVIGSGEVKYTAVYARRQYYENKGRGTEGLHASGGTSGKRGAYWFERMKADQKDDILKKAQEAVK